MISLLHEPDYEMLGAREIHDSEWQQIRKVGFFRFVLKRAFGSWTVWIVAFLLCATVGDLYRSGKIEKVTWFLIGWWIYVLVVNIIHAVRAWRRLEYRFNPRRSEI